MWVDGVPVGHPTYNQYRPDIATLFPGYANSDGAVGFFYLDPSSLAEGAHSIAWSVEDSLGRLDGIGSRYFMVEHASGGVGAGGVGAKDLSPLPGEPAITGIVDAPQPLRVRRGFAGTEETVYPGRDGQVVIVTQGNQPLEIRLDPDFQVGEPGLLRQHPDPRLPVGPARFFGCERVASDLRRLPVGSRLDPQTGVFTWLPGPGFRGEFVLEFLGHQGGAALARQRIRVRVE